MKATLICAALLATAPFVWSQSTTTEKTTTTTTTTTTGTGTITEYEPGKTIVLKESAGPRHYRFGKKVVYVTKAGKEIPEAEVRTRIKVGAPVEVHYVKEHDDMLVDRVIVGD